MFLTISGWNSSATLYLIKHSLCTWYEQDPKLLSGIETQSDVPQFFNYPEKDPQWMTEHKTPMVSNQFLGAVSVKLGFHQHIRQNNAVGVPFFFLKKKT